MFAYKGKTFFHQHMYRNDAAFTCFGGAKSSWVEWLLLGSLRRETIENKIWYCVVTPPTLIHKQLVFCYFSSSFFQHSSPKITKERNDWAESSARMLPRFSMSPAKLGGKMRNYANDSLVLIMHCMNYEIFNLSKFVRTKNLQEKIIRSLIKLCFSLHLLREIEKNCWSGENLRNHLKFLQTSFNFSVFSLETLSPLSRMFFFFTPPLYQTMASISFSHFSLFIFAIVVDNRNRSSASLHSKKNEKNCFVMLCGNGFACCFSGRYLHNFSLN